MRIDLLTAIVLPSRELCVNGQFTNGVDGWTPQNTSAFTASGNRATVTNNGLQHGKAYQGIPTVIGQRYRVRATLVSLSAGFGRVFAQATEPILNDSVNSSRFNSSVPATADFVYTATATTTYLIFGNRNDDSASLVWANLSFKRAP